MSKISEKLKNVISGNATAKPTEELTSADVNFTKDDPPVEQTTEQSKEEQLTDKSTPPAPEEQQKVDPPVEEKTMNYKWIFAFKLTTGIKVEVINIETKTEIDNERLAFNQALAKMTAHEKYRGSTDLSYTQKFTKEKITQE